MNLKWGGRQFGRSRFGNCPVKLINGAFVYSAEVMTPAILASQTLEQPFPRLVLTRSLSGLPPGLDAELQQLWHYFVTTASGTISCHKQMQNETCRVLLPMAFEDPALRHAILAFSSAHRANQKDSETSWESLKLHASASVLSDPSVSFLRRRYSLLEMVASLTPDGFLAEDSNYESPETSQQPYRVFFDDYAGCYPEIFEVFHQIRAISWKRQQKEHDSYEMIPLYDPQYELDAINIEGRLLAMIKRDESSRPCFSPSLQDTLDEKQTLEFAYCNLLLEYTALIHIRTQLMSLDSEALEVQQPVKMIIHLIQQLEPPSGLSPVLGVNTALFIAGRYAFGADRLTVQSLLIRFHQKMFNYNMVNAMDILDLIWRQVDSGQKNIGLQGHDFMAW
ncbi:uncharacterized protein N7511_007618 [Penicillium nucicola]|uniref:uncharacterized protein n=1 Tax=Penicillium nucicola TaxID=1850975 RepID=UPI0025450110|nr:uncharacterized protein N7511_007618 [Penicillium nucicola]KAJ5753465.1 hypothetical protein N7511_007618 [Penicillium nucicola]